MNLGIRKVLDKLFNPEKPKEERFADLDEMDREELLRLRKLVMESGFGQGAEEPTAEGKIVPDLTQKEKKLPEKIVASGKEIE